MYQGKFSSNKKGSSNIQDIVAQRNASPKAQPLEEEVVVKPAKKAAPVKEAPVVKEAPAAKKAPKKQPEAAAPAKKEKAPAAEKPEKKKAKKGPRLGGVIFYTFYCMFILIFCAATFLGLNWLRGWLTDYEAAQPTVKSQEVFDQLFANPNWSQLYDAAGIQDTAYEGKDVVVAYLEENYGNSQMTYLETSAGLSGDKKYIVKADDKKVATFTLEDDSEGIASIPEWQMGAVELFFEREEVFRIEKKDGHTAYVNGIALDESFTIQKATTVAQEYLPAGTVGVTMETQEISGLMALPTVTIQDDKGQEMEVVYNEETRTFVEQLESNTITDAEKEVALNAAKNYCLWMIKEVTNRDAIAKYFDTSSQVYNDIVKTTELWMQDHNGYRFANETVTDYCRYTDNLFSAKVSLSLNVTRTNGTVREYTYAQTLFFVLNENGSWKAFDMTNVDVQKPVGQVRLTFMQDDTLLTSDFYATDATELVTPTISIPEGKVLTGWVTHEKDEKGRSVYNLVFQPDEFGNVTIPAGNTLTPMKLYALIENEGATSVPATVAPAETAPAETAAVSAPETTAAIETTEGA